MAAILFRTTPESKVALLSPCLPWGNRLSIETSACFPPPLATPSGRDLGRPDLGLYRGSQKSNFAWQLEGFCVPWIRSRVAKKSSSRILFSLRHPSRSSRRCCRRIGRRRRGCPGCRRSWASSSCRGGSRTDSRSLSLTSAGRSSRTCSSRIAVKKN